MTLGSRIAAAVAAHERHSAITSVTDPVFAACPHSTKRHPISCRACRAVRRCGPRLKHPSLDAAVALVPPTPLTPAVARGLSEMARKRARRTVREQVERSGYQGIADALKLA